MTHLTRIDSECSFSDKLGIFKKFNYVKKNFRESEIRFFGKVPILIICDIHLSSWVVAG